MVLFNCLLVMRFLFHVAIATTLKFRIPGSLLLHPLLFLLLQVTTSLHINSIIVVAVIEVDTTDRNWSGRLEDDVSWASWFYK